MNYSENPQRNMEEQHYANTAAVGPGTLLDAGPFAPRPIQIRPLSRGYVVEVGCQSFAFSTKREMLGKIVDYLNNPKAVETAWQNNTLFQDPISNFVIQDNNS